MATLGAYTVVRNTEVIKYPWRASVVSSLALADRVFVCDALSSDGTWEILYEWAKREPRLTVMRHPWGDHYTILPRICNGILENPGLKAMDFAIQIQADEVACEWSIGATRKYLDELPNSVGLGSPRYTHFCPDVRTTWPFLYARKAVLSRVSTGVRWAVARGGDACSLVGLPGSELPLEVFHYGKVETGRREAALHKEVTFKALYRDMGFPDKRLLEQVPSGKIDYRKLFTTAEFTPYHGPHPSFAAEWIAGLETA